MNTARLVARLEAFARVLPAAVACVDPDEARWKPPSGAWSVLEIVNHLADEEVEDFWTRLERTLRNPDEPWERIDPERAARERGYNERELRESVDRFVRARRESIVWLRGLPAEADWSVAHRHPAFGPIAAGDLLASWAAHDALHLRQIAKRLHELASRDAPGFETGYAGEWRA
jgi:hypothetical protein